MSSARLDPYAEPPDPRAVVLFLHGGQQDSLDPVQDKHASWWRLALMARRLRRFAEGEGIATYLLQYRHRGWNDPGDPSPVRDAREALSALRTAHPGLPVVLVGHSMGGRTACRVADDPAVVGVVGLAPWLPEGEPVDALAGRDLLVIHGSRDRWTSARWSLDFVERAVPLARRTGWTSLPGVGHFMFRRVRDWNRFVTDSVLQILRPPTSAEEATHPADGSEGRT